MIRKAFQNLPKHFKGFFPWSQTDANLISHSFCNRKQPPQENSELKLLLKQMMIMNQEKEKREEVERLQRIKKEQEKEKREEVERLQRIKKEQQKEKREEVERLQRIKREKIIQENYKTSIKLAAFGLACAVGGFVYTVRSDAREQAKKIQTRRSQLLIEHHKQFKSDQNELYIKGKSVQGSLKSILQSKTKSIELVLGVQGIGKTSAIKKLINQKRKQKIIIKENQKDVAVKQKIYYINLGANEKQKKGQETLQIFDKMSELITAIKLDIDGKTPTTLVIDDINRLEKIQNPDKRQSKQMNILDLSKEGVKIILISSSTYFYHSIWVKELFRKNQNIQAHLIWAMKEQQCKQILFKKGQKLKISKKLVEKVVNYGLALRDSIALLNAIVNSKLQQEEKVIDMLQTQIQGQKNKINSILNTFLLENEKFSMKASYQLLQEITKNKMYDNVSTANIKNCDQLEKKDQFSGSIKIMKEIIEGMDKQNLIIMCYPRSRLIMKVFQDKLKQLEKKLKKK